MKRKDHNERRTAVLVGDPYEGVEATHRGRPGKRRGTTRLFETTERKGKYGVEKGAWGMPRLSEAMKDVISCEKPR